MIDDKKIIHLLINTECRHNCKYCCNKQYDIDEIPVVTVGELKYADTVCLTGGEPFYIDVDDLAWKIKHQYPNIQNIYVYTSGSAFATYIIYGGSLRNVDGVNISPKDTKDVERMEGLVKTHSFKEKIDELRSNRIYIFPEMQNRGIESWNFKNTEIIYREWQKEFKPNGGIFRRLPILFD